MNRLIAAAAALCLATSAYAVSPLTQNVDFVGPADFTNAKGVTTNVGAAPFFFFDKTVGTLNSVEFSSNYSFASTGTVTAIAASSGSVGTESAAQFSSTDANVTAALNNALNTISSSNMIGGAALSPAAYDITGNTSSYNLAPGMTTAFASSGGGFQGPITVSDAATLAAFSRVGTFSYDALITTRTGANIQQTGGSTSISQTSVLNGRLTIVYNFTPLGIGDPGTGGVPEPATWAMMIVGFGSVGASLRGARRSGVRIG